MRYDWYQIHAILENRRDKQSPLIKQMVEVRDRYNADWVLPSLSAETMAQMPNLSPQLIADTVDNYGMRAGSVMPAIFCPAVNPTKPKGVNSVEYGTVRSDAIRAIYKHSRMQLQLRKAFRHMAGYATSAMVVMPDFRDGLPRISLRDPLTTYPDPISGEDFRNPTNIGFIFAKSPDWIAQRYPETRGLLQMHNRSEVMWNMCEWIDEDDVVVGLLGPQEFPSQSRYQEWKPADWSKELRRWPNRIGWVPAICPARVTLDRIASQLANLIGTTDLMAKLTALDIMAKEKSIFPDRYIMGKMGATPSIVGGEWKDGRTGEVNILLDADGIGSMNFANDPSASQAIDRLERNVRVSAGLVPQMGGETYGALRTGRGVDALMGAAVDPRLMEMQVTMGTWLSYLNECALRTLKEYWPNKQYSLSVGGLSARKQVEFVPSRHIEIFANETEYPMAGADAQSMTIGLGQLFGMKAISKKTLMETHPWIGDAATEKALIDEETLEDAMMQSLMQAIATGSASPMLLAFVEEARRKDPNGDIITAVATANRRMQEEQAKQAPPPEPGQVTAPEAQPGMAPELAQQQEQPGGIETPGDMGQLRQLMNALGQTSGVVTR